MIKTTQPGSAPVLYEYDALGTLIASGLDTNDDGELTAGSTDRFTACSTGYHKIGNDWWWKETSTVYTINNDASAGATTTTLTRLTGFSGNLRSETRITDALDNTTVTTVSVDRGSRLVTETTTLPGAIGTDVRVFYNGKLSAVTSALGETVRYAYDALGRLALTTPHRTRPVQTLYVTGTGGLARSQVLQNQYDGNSFIVGYEYDKAGRVSKITDAAGAEILREYNCRGQIITEWGSGVQPVTYLYDDYGRLRTQKTYRGIAGGTKPGKNDPGDPTAFGYYNDTGWLMTRTDAAGKETFYTYDEAGRLQSQTTPRGHTITLGYDPLTGDLSSKTWTTSTTGSGTAGITYAYTRTGALASVTDPATGTRIFDYGIDGLRLETENLPANFYGPRTLNYQYQYGPGAGSAAGRLEGYSLRHVPGMPAQSDLELTACFAFDTGGRIAAISAEPGAQTSRVFEYSYLATAPGLVSGVDEMSVGYHREQTWEGDRNLLVSISTSFGVGADAVLKSRHAYTHDARGLRASAVQSGRFFADYGGGGDAPGATAMSYTYNARGELTGAAQHMGDVSAATASASLMPGRQWSYAYDSAGNRTAAGGEAYGANNLNQTTTREHNKRHLSGTGVPGVKVADVGPEDSTRAPAAYQGRFWSAEILLNNENAPAKGLVDLYFGKREAGATNGALLKRGAASDPGLALFMPKSPEQFIYDDDGNLTADGKWSHTYDALNQLVAMETLAVEGNNVRAALLSIAQGEQPRRLEFAYDYMGRRVEKKVYNYDPAAGTAAQWVLAKTTRYLYQGWNLIAEFDTGSAGILPAGSGVPPVDLASPARTYHWGLDTAGTLTQTGGVGALLMIQDGGNQYFPACDGNGNITGLINGSGETVAVYEYSPYGELLRCQGSYAKQNPFRFSTKYWDEETGLAYYGLRYYSPQMGKFINRDPIGENSGLNLYGFVMNNPVNLLDILGLRWVQVAKTYDENRCELGDYLGNDKGGMFTGFTCTPNYVTIFDWVWVDDDVVMMETFTVRDKRIKDTFVYEDLEKLFQEPNNAPSQSTTGTTTTGTLTTSGTTPASSVPPRPDFMNDRKVVKALNQAWADSNPNAPNVVRGNLGSTKVEQGGWIVKNDNPWWAFWRDDYTVIRVTAGTRDGLATIMGTRPTGVDVVGWFHTHPNTAAEGYYHVAGPGDIGFTQNTAKVPGIIKTHNGDVFIPYP